MNRFKEVALQSLRLGEEYSSIIYALEEVVKEMKQAEQYLKAYNEKDFHP